jgi:radical SAM superfamily enzyme YgiQ (UPF0313 family)
LKWPSARFTIAAMEKVDCLLLHIPKSRNYSRPARHGFSLNAFPTRLLGLADLLFSHDISTEIVHLELQKMEDPQFSILRYIEERKPGVVIFDLHRHAQSFDVMEIVKEVKAAFPSLFVLLVGHTASFYHEEILDRFNEVNGVLRGEVEQPLLELIKTLLEGKENLFAIPNLTWRRKGRVLVNPLSYIASEEDLDRLCFTRFPLLKNYPTYIRHAPHPFCVRGRLKEKNRRKHPVRFPVFHLPVGRGCPVQCTWCSGGMSCQRTISGRTRVIFRNEARVVESMEEAVSYGFETFHISFDPSPQNPEYFLRLFSRIREKELTVECIFECYGLPTIRFIQAFKETFPGSRSRLILSPDAGSDRLRKTHKGFAYTNRALMESLQELRHHGVLCELFFALGIPFEEEKDVNQLLQLQNEIRSHHPNVKGIRTFVLGMEPGSPWQVDPEVFGIATSLRSFMDYYHFHSRKDNLCSSPGYWIPDHFEGASDEESFTKIMQKIKCRHFCSYHPNEGKTSDPYWGKKLCDLSTLYWKARDWVQRKRV